MNLQQWREYLQDNQPEASLVNDILNDWEASLTPTIPVRIDSSNSFSNNFFDPFLQQEGQ